MQEASSETTIQEQKYEEAYRKTLQYFPYQDELATKVFLDKYALRDNTGAIAEQTPDEMHRRLAREFARIEANKFSKPYSEEFLFKLFERFSHIIPQGSPMFGIGNPNQIVSLSNCFVIPSPEDSYGGILKSDEYLVQICKRRGGVGFDISNLRPNKTPTTNASRSSTGIIPFMHRYSHSINEVGQDGRRGALMMTLSVHHPEIMEFIESKRNKGAIEGANISVRLTDEFLTAVTNNSEYQVRWPVITQPGKEPKISKMINAKEVWNKIIDNAHFRAEPGLLFWDNIIRESPADCYPGFTSTSTNPCSEIPMCPNDSCRLMLINVFACIIDAFTDKAKFSFDKLYQLAKVAQRLMDDMIDLELECIDKILHKIEFDPENESTKRTELDLWIGIRQKCIDGRRTGLGLTGIGDAIASIGLKYGSQESIDFVDKVYQTLKHAAYRSSVDMAKELGAFPAWNYELEKNCPFLVRLFEEDPALKADMIQYGRRNIALLTSAPAGTTSIEGQVTTGIEPLVWISYVKRKKINANDENSRVDFVDASGNKWQHFKVFHPKVRMWMDVTGKTDEKESPWYGCCANDINWVSRVKLQAAAQKHVDHAISSTVNLPKDVDVETVSQIYEAAWKHGCKGMTVYREGCRDGVLVSSTFQKRPKTIPCDIYHPSVKGNWYFVLVGIHNGKPYEVFAGKHENIGIRNYTKGEIAKYKRKGYQLTFEGEPILENIADLIDDNESAITRLVSLLLRHENDISFVVHQLEKVPGGLNSFSKAIARILKKYIPDGVQVYGEDCPDCKAPGTLVRQEGCVLCSSCGWTKCN